jgi:hypothetical protein
MAEAVYVLCAATSIACGVLLFRAWWRTRVRLLLWTFACFALLAVNSVLLVVDLAIVTETDLSVARGATALAGLLVLLYGLIYDRGSGSGA